MTLIYLGVGWLLGLAWGAFCPLRWPIWVALSVLPLLAAVLRRDKRSVWRLYLALAFLLLGAGRYRLAAAGDTHLAAYNGRGWVTITGVVAAEPAPQADLTRLVVAVDSIQVEGQPAEPVSGRVMLEAPRYPAYHYGDMLQVAGRLHAPPEYPGFSYRAYLARQDVYSLMRRPLIEPLTGAGGSWLKRSLFSFKAAAQRVVQAILPSPESALLTGVVLGNDRDIPDRLMEAFNATGATHVIAISGFNISILSALMLSWLGRLMPQRAAGLLTVGGIAVYTVLVGAEAAVVRAAVMGSLLVAGRLLGRRTFGPTSLSAAAVAMTAVNPLLVADIGFQLSVAATLGLMLVSELTPRDLPAGELAQLARLSHLLGETLLLTLVAQLATLPLLAYYFGRISPISPLVNLLIQFAQPPLMILGSLATLAGSLWLPLGQILGWLSYPFLWWTIRAVEVGANLPFASVQIDFSAAALVVSYLLLAGLVGWAFHCGGQKELWQRVSRRLDLKLLAAATIVNLILVGSVLARRPDGRLHVYFLDVGEGEATLIETPSGRWLLVDGGPDPAAVQAHLGRRLPLWLHSLDLVVATHPDYEHINGLPAVLERYPAGAVMTNGAENSLAAWAELERLIERNEIPLVLAQPGQIVAVEDGVSLQVLRADGGTAGDQDDGSIVTRLAYGEVSFLLTADIKEAAELDLVESGFSLQSTVLKLPNGGDRDGTSDALLAASSPQVVVFSVGARNPERHPYPRVLARVQALGVPVLRTDEVGTIHLITDGQHLDLLTERD